MKYAREVALALLLVALLVAAAILEPKFVTWRAQALLATHAWELAIVAVPMFLIIVAGGIDLSVGSVVAVSAVSFGLSFERGLPVAVCVCVALLTGLVAGCINGFFAARTRVHSLLFTLATMTALRGIAEGISLARPFSGYPESFQRVMGGWFPVCAFAALAFSAHILMTKWRVGRWIRALGTNETATRFSLIPVDRLRFWLFGFCGACCGLAAVILVARNNTAKADMGLGMELEAITAVVLGGARIEGGSGRIVGLFLGLALIHESREFVSWHWKQHELNLIVVGVLLIGAVLIDQVLSRRKQAAFAHNG